ncbi:hypothetical protein [Streptomyces aureoversilis]|uniref:Peptidase M41 domain-containing protein n=1 Tax=Streptomyces aureoversilis TaxID=67277 RepID=A0ABW0A7E1_9ACTN
MWFEGSVNGLEVHTQYSNPFPSEILDPDTAAGGLSPGQLHARDAHHEAGHAVVGIVLGLPVTRATLHVRSDLAPAPPGTYVETGHVALGPFVAPLEDLVTFHMAGVRAAHRWLDEQRLLTPATAFLNDVIGGLGDQASLRAVKTERPVQFTWGTGRPDTLRDSWDHVDVAEVYSRADALIKLYWPQITSVAHHLLDHSEASEDDLRALLETRSNISSTPERPADLAPASRLYSRP